VLGVLHDVAPLDDGLDPFECHGFLLVGVVRERGYRKPLIAGRQEPGGETAVR
jgi:hypothetical protein